MYSRYTSRLYIVCFNGVSFQRIQMLEMAVCVISLLLQELGPTVANCGRANFGLWYSAPQYKYYTIYLYAFQLF